MVSDDEEFYRKESLIEFDGGISGEVSKLWEGDVDLWKRWRLKSEENLNKQAQDKDFL